MAAADDIAEDLVLYLVVLEAVDDDGLTMKPYRYDERFNRQWWDDDDGPGSRYLAVTDERNVEVARAELEDIESDPWKVYPTIQDVNAYTEVLFFEVARDNRRAGIGRKAAQLVAKYSSRPLLALSDEADHFWRALGWEEHQPVRSGHRTAFTEPRA